MSDSERLKKRMIELRGSIIQETIRIEATIDSILIGHYAQNQTSKKVEFHEHIISPMRFHQKKDLLIRIYKSLGYEEPKIKELGSALKVMQELRNKVAHWNWVSITDENVLLAKTDYIKFSIDDKELKKFEFAKKKQHLI